MSDIMERADRRNRRAEDIANSQNLKHTLEQISSVNERLERIEAELRKVKADVNHITVDDRDLDKELKEIKNLLSALDKLLALHSQDAEHRKDQVSKLGTEFSEMKKEVKEISVSSQKSAILISVIIALVGFFGPILMKLLSGNWG